MCVAAFSLLVMPVSAQVSNDNEDGVYKVDERMAQFNRFVPGQVLVKFKDESTITVLKAKGKFAAASVSSVNAVLTKFGVETMDKLLPNEVAKPKSKLRRAKAFNGQTVEEKNLDKIYLVSMETESPDTTMQLVNALDSLDEVEYAEPNYIAYITASPQPSPTWEGAASQKFSFNAASAMLENTSETSDSVICKEPSQNPLYSQQWGIRALHVDSLWNKPIINSKRPVIAILDTGVDITHPDLKDNIWTNEKEGDGETGYDDDGNGFVDDVHGWDFVYNYNEMGDNNSHGTHVAGIAAASDNAIGIVGANPRALIMPVKVLDDDGTGTVANIVKGINYAANNGADVINMSLGSGSISQAMMDALETAYQTATIVASAGNGMKSIYDHDGGLVYPGAYYCVIGVQATVNSVGTLAFFSNYDPDGPVYSKESPTIAKKRVKDPTVLDGNNYEVKAPGTGIISSVPNGGYQQMNGTSMSSPLVAGAISALKMVKDFASPEVLISDLAHMDCDFARIYSDEERSTDIYLAGMACNDTITGNKNIDGEVDGGETVELRPILLNSWSTATDIKLHLDVDSAMAKLVTIDNPDVDFGYSLSPYAHMTSKNPFIIHVTDSLDDGANVKFVLTCYNSDNVTKSEYYMPIENMIKLGGLIEEDSTLIAGRVYNVTSNLGIAKDATLTIEPGVQVKVKEGKSISIYGKIIAKGCPQKPILFSPYNPDDRWSYGINFYNNADTIYYCKFDNMWISIANKSFPTMFDCEFSNSILGDCQFWMFKGERCNMSFIRWNSNYSQNNGPHPNRYFNYVAYEKITAMGPWYSEIENCNYVNSPLSYYTSEPSSDHADNPSYLGTARADIALKHFSLGDFNKVDLSNMLKEPVHEAHGILWKVVVDGKDAQDEFEQMDPLGVGTHKFEVYFNRAMNVNINPTISYGVRRPYTQHEITGEGTWSADSTIYTINYTLTGRESTDGLNRIYVRGAEDNEYFECPYDSTRFNMIIQSAGSMATGFMATAGIGRVNLTWNNDNNNFEDAMGFNVYRYTMVNDSTSGDTIRINREIISVDSTSYTDYDVVAGKTYYYYYKVLSTDLKEYDISNVVACTVLTSTKGDANGSGAVDVADVVTTVNYAAGQNPKPFLFDAADMNSDSSIDILDVIGIIKAIINPDSETTTEALATATYSIENGMVYVDCAVPLAGVQVQVNMDEKVTPSTADDLEGFEHTAAWLTDNDYIFLAYNMNGKTLTAGKHALLNIGEATLSSLCLSDAQGHNVKIVSANPTGIGSITGTNKRMSTQRGIYNLSGQKVAGDASQLKSLPSGVYIVDGQKVVK